jgi:cysteinyl-tRNA synthetase
MILRYLGESFDIHGGGLDLRFPHHENEQAQSRAAGYGFARYWMHNGWVTSGGDKISKSLGNATPLDDLLQHMRPLDLRYYLGSAHYRSNLELTDSALRSATAAMRRIEDFITRSTNHSRRTADADMLPVAFRNALDDDLNIPMALAVLHDEVRQGNTALAQHDARAGADALDAVLAMTGVLGINPRDSPWDESTATPPLAERALEALIAQALNQRAQARKARDFRTADRIRDELDAAGIVLNDSQSGTTWGFTEGDTS